MNSETHSPNNVFFIMIKITFQNNIITILLVRNEKSQSKNDSTSPNYYSTGAIQMSTVGSFAAEIIAFERICLIHVMMGSRICAHFSLRENGA